MCNRTRTLLANGLGRTTVARSAFAALLALAAAAVGCSCPCRTSPPRSPAPSTPSPAARAAEPALQKFEYVKPKMGTGFRIVLYAPDRKSAAAAAAAAFARIDQLNAILS